MLRCPYRAFLYLNHEHRGKSAADTQFDFGTSLRGAKGQLTFPFQFLLGLAHL